MNTRIFLVAAAMVAIMAVPTFADAQRRPTNNGQRYQQNNRGNIERLVNKAEKSSNQFRADFERLWDNSRERNWSRDWDRDWTRGSQTRNRTTDRSSRYTTRYSPKESVQRLDEAMERLRAAVNRDRRDSNARDYQVGRNEMMEVVRAADNIDFYFGRGRNYNGNLDRQWSKVRKDIDALADFYNIHANGRWN